MSSTEQLKNTSLTHVHESLGGKMVPFAGFNMPVQYSNLKEEHMAVRNSVGMFDVSHMGEFLVKGEGATALIEWVTSNDVGKLVDMQAQYNCFPNNDGGIVDDLIVYKWNDTEYNLVINASNIEKDWNWIVAQNEEKGFGAELKDMSDDLSLLAVQGPNAQKLIQGLTDVDLSVIEFYHFGAGAVAGIDDIIISNTGYTGSGGFELYIPNAVAEEVWKKVFEAGEEFGIKPIGLAARDTLRLEMGYCLYGNDISDTSSPLEAGLGWVTKFTKEFTNSAALQAQKETGVTRKLVGFELIDRGIPRHDYPIVDVNGNEIGIVTSGTMAPSLKKAIGLGYVTTEFASEGSEIFIQVRNKQLKATVVKPPFK